MLGKAIRDQASILSSSSSSSTATGSSPAITEQQGKKQEALHWNRMAANQGDADAKIRLQVIESAKQSPSSATLQQTPPTLKKLHEDL